MSRYEKSAPVPISMCKLPALPIAGMVAVPTMRSFGEVGVPMSTVTTSPTCLCNWARVTGPSTT